MNFMNEPLNELENDYLNALSHWHLFYNNLSLEDRKKFAALNREMHAVFFKMQEIIRVTRFGSDDEILNYHR